MTLKPWHHFPRLKDEFRIGEITLAAFSVDLQGPLARMAQALIELAKTRVGKSAILEGIRNRQTAQGAAVPPPEALLSE